MRAKVPGDGSTGTDSGIGIDDRSYDGTYVGSGFDQARLNCGISESWTTSREGTPYSPARTDMVTDYSIVDISRNGSTNVKFNINDSLKFTSSSNVPLDTMGFFFYTDHASQLIYVDWVAVRKYEETEPAWGTWTEAESLITATAISKIMGINIGSLSKFMNIAKGSIVKIGGAIVPSSYATWNPSDKGSEITLSDKNNVATKSGSGSSFANSGIRSTIGKSSGKWYWEYVYTEDGGSNWPVVGVGNLSANMSDHVGSDTNGWGVYAPDGYKYYNDIGSSYGTSFTQGDVIGVALNMDTGKVWFSKNGTWMNSGDPAAGTNEAFSGLTGTIYAFIVMYQPGSIWTAKFGATALSYVAPSGYKSGLYSS